MKKFLAILLSALMILSTVSVMAAEVGSATMAVEYVSNGVFRISGTLPGSGDYKVIAAEYDADGKMIDAKTAAAVDDFGMFSTTMELSYAPADTKFMLWEMGEAAPCAEAVALPEEGGINVITAKTEVGSSSGGNNTSAPLTNLVDGDADTCAILYGGDGSKTAMFVDLEAEYEIDRIEVLAYHDPFGVRGSGFDVVLGNNVPDNIPYEEDEGEFKAGYVEEDFAATSAAVGYKTFYVPEDAGSYRYVSFETFDETDGISIADVKVYVKSVGEQVEYVSVTDNATSHKASSTATITTYETDANNALVDGSLSTVYGTGPVSGAYYTFLDLGVGGRPVNKVVITAVDSISPNRVKGQKYYLANNVPIAGADRSDWVYLGTRINASVPMTFILDEDQAGTYRYVVVDCTDASVGGIISEIEVYKDKNISEIEYVSVTENATTHLASSTDTAATYDTDPSNRLVDGNLSTLYGVGPAPNAYYTFIDLGEGGRRVDKVAITVNDTVSPDRIKGQKYYLANTLPIAGADRSGWVFLGERVQNGVTMTFVLDATQAGVYRYVVADCTDAAVGGYVNEIQVYKDKSVAEVEYVSVTDKATSHKSAATATAFNYETDKNNALVDGSLSTSYGTGPAASAYYTFVDLGEGGRRVDKVAITSIDTISPDRIKGQKYYLANTLPIAGADRSGWVFLGERVQSGVTMTFILDETQAGVYRYVVADCTDAAVGGYVNEIEVFKNAAIEEKIVKNVALGKSSMASHAGYDVYTNTAVITDGKFNAADGNNQIICTTIPSNVCIDLGAECEISKLVIDAVLCNDKYDFTKNLDVYVSDKPSTGMSIPADATKVVAGSTDSWGTSVKTFELESAVNGRYVIIQKTAKGADNDSFRLAEVEVYGSETETAGYGVVKSSADVTSYYYQYGSANGTSATGTTFTDNYSHTFGGRGQHWDIGWIDLGAAKQIDGVKVQVNDQYMGVPSTPMVFYVTNEDPGASAAASIAENGKFVVPSTWVAVNGDGHSWTKTGLGEASYDLATSGMYRYVVCTAPTRDFVNDSSIAGMPAYVSEIVPYIVVSK